MSHRYYSEINLHITWHTKHSAPTLTEELEKVAHRDIRDRAFATPSVVFHEVGGTETHVHVAVSIPPTLLISEWIGKLKGGSSHAVNQALPAQAEHFAWQEGYGVVSFGTQNLEWVIKYIRNQKEHHATGKNLVERLERIDAEE
jgi:putative transposase